MNAAGGKSARLDWAPSIYASRLPLSGTGLFQHGHEELICRGLLCRFTEFLDMDASNAMYKVRSLLTRMLDGWAESDPAGDEPGWLTGRAVVPDDLLVSRT